MNNLKRIVGIIMVAVLAIGFIGNAFGSEFRKKGVLERAIDEGRIEKVKEIFDNKKYKDLINKEIKVTGLTPLQQAVNAYASARMSNLDDVAQNIIEIMKYLKKQGAKVTQDVAASQAGTAAGLKEPGFFGNWF